MGSIILDSWMWIDRLSTYSFMMIWFHLQSLQLGNIITSRFLCHNVSPYFLSPHIYSKIEHLLCFIRSDLRTRPLHSATVVGKRRSGENHGKEQPFQAAGATYKWSYEWTLLWINISSQNPFPLILRYAMYDSQNNVYWDNFCVQTYLRSNPNEIWHLDAPEQISIY